MSSASFEAVIGLEVHVQLATESKIFCSCPARLPAGRSVADEIPNSNVCPICAGHPGTLPVLNRKVLEYAVKAGLATGCEIRLNNTFARKNYFYPDLPKGYQLSQFDRPICEGGFLKIETEGGAKTVRIQRIHMEEDAGKSVHQTHASVVNLNRAGVPLVEIVSHPDLSTPEEAGAYLRGLYGVVTYLGICDGNLQEGNFRCDANVSVRPRGTTKLGTRTEIKNVNSFRFVEKAIEFEIGRQIGVIQSGAKIIQETRLYDSQKNVTLAMRSKEEAQDYRYFPDPDLIDVQLEASWVAELKRNLPELPEQKRVRYRTTFGLSREDAGVLTSSRWVADFFEKSVTLLVDGGLGEKVAAKPAANLLMGMGVEGCPARLTPRHVADLVAALQKSEISSTAAKQVLQHAGESGDAVSAIIEREGLRQVSDLGALEPVIDKVIAGFPNQVAEYRSGKEKLLGFFVGQVMKEMGGKANPALLQGLVQKKLVSGEDSG